MKTILFIEDEQALQRTFGDILTKEKYKMISALDGELGLTLAKTSKPDLIFLDIILPKVQGLEVLKKLKESPETAEIPVIMLTNLDDLENVEKALSLGAVAYFVKAEYKVEELIEKIKKVLGE